MFIRAGIIGVTGYTGRELLGILLRHPYVRLTRIYSRSEGARPVDEIFPQFKARTSLACRRLDLKDLSSNCDVVFLALPHTASMEIVPKLLKAGKKVIDLSADYRLKDVKVYEKFYQAKHKDKAHLAKAVYGLPEIYRARIKDATLIANPGCYPAAAILALAPLAAMDLIDCGSVIIDAKSGVSGAGKKLIPELSFSEVDEDFKAYKVNTHQHIPEIAQELSKLSGAKIGLTFVPHLLPLDRGILETIYVRKIKNPKSKIKNFIGLYKNFYKKEPFVRIRDEGVFPRLKDVAGTNFCDIGIKEDKDGAIVIAAIDNLLKGASGQAVQNLNIMYKVIETTGLL